MNTSFISRLVVALSCVWLGVVDAVQAAQEPGTGGDPAVAAPAADVGAAPGGRVLVPLERGRGGPSGAQTAEAMVSPAPAASLIPSLHDPDDVALLKTGLRINHPGRRVAFYGYVELGALSIASHTFQSGRNGSLFDLKNEGNQSTMFFFARLSAELEFLRRHSFIFVYQPIDLRTEAVAKRDLSFDQVTFRAGTPMDLRYGFDFYRLTYQFDVFKSPRYELAFGLGGQVRNAKIVFTSVDGQQRSISDDLGFVPLLRLRARYTFQNGLWLGAEADGFYANVAVLNGGRSDVEGAIWDASLRLGLRLTTFMDAFVNLRYLGGGASGTSANGSDNPGGDGYTYNWLHAVVVSLGFGVR